MLSRLGDMPEWTTIEWTRQGSDGRAGGAAFFPTAATPNPLRVWNAYDAAAVALSAIIAAYGTPTAVIAQASTHGYGAQAGSRLLSLSSPMYEDDGFIVSAENKSVGAPPPITATLPVEGLTFFPSKTRAATLIITIPVAYAPTPVPWAGFHAFAFYCRDAHGEPCSL